VGAVAAEACTSGAEATVGCHKYWYRVNAQATKLYAALIFCIPPLCINNYLYSMLYSIN
jgi:hypothetical protein